MNKWLERIYPASPAAAQSTMVTLYGMKSLPLDDALLVERTLELFPALALGLSGFETGVVVMPLVQGDSSDTHAEPKGRIRNARKLLTTAALVMSVMLMGSAMVTTLLIPARERVAQRGERRPLTGREERGTGDRIRLQDACTELDAAQKAVDDLYARWGELEKKLS